MWRQPRGTPWPTSWSGASARELLAGSCSPGSPPSRTCARSGRAAGALDGTGDVLVLADAAPPRGRARGRRRLAEGPAGRDAPCSWAWRSPARPTRTPARFPFVDDVLVRPVTAARLRLRLERALDAIEQPARASSSSRRAFNPQEPGAARAEQDRRGALRRARHRQAAGAHPAQEPRDHRRRRGQPLPRGARQGRGAAEDDCCASSWRRTTRWRCPSRRSRCRSARPRSRATWPSPARCVNVADAYNLPAGLALQDQPRLRREVGLPHEVDAGRADARPPGQGHRRRPAHQQEARPRDRAAAGLAGGRHGHPVHLGRRGAA